MTKRFASAWCSAVAAAALLTPGPATMARAQDSSGERPGEAKGDRDTLLAASYHDLVLLYVKNADFDSAANEARKILQLRLPEDQEHLVAQSFGIIANRLVESRRFDLAQGLLDDALKALQIDTNRAKILLTKARIYRQSGDDRRAIESFKRAIELGQRGR